MDEQTWNTVDRLVAWLDQTSSLPPETDRLLRVMKLSEEVGETTQAVIGVLGSNPPLTELNHSSVQVSDYVGRRSLAGACMRMSSS